ncbi:uncharacterized protein LOC143278146 [Babylonia areolata]|uniref:uncharacterized protein LOC143278146 n=1 Tax=Babylonia areolata TaxID=304850 RepID=UPI003FD44445
MDSTTANTSFLSASTSFYSNITEMWNTSPLSNSSGSSPSWEAPGGGSVYHRSLKDQTTFIAAIVMGVIVPAIFIAVIALICRRRRKDLLARRTQMLLQNTQDFVLEDYTTMEKATSPPPKI